MSIYIPPFPLSTFKDVLRVPQVFLFAEGVQGSATEALFPLSQSRQYETPTTGTTFVVAANKTLRITTLTVAFVSTNGTLNTSRIRLRVSLAGVATLSSPVAYSTRLAWSSPTIVARLGTTLPLAFPDGLDIPPGAALALSHEEQDSNDRLDIGVTGFEY